MIFGALKVVGIALGVLVLLIVSVLIGMASSRKAKIRRKITALPVSRIADLRDGAQVRVVGEVAQAEETLLAPLSKRDVAAWEVVVRYTEHGKGGSGGRRSEAVDFLLRDSSGSLLVTISDAAFAMAEDHEEDFRFQEAPEILHDIFTAQGNSVEPGPGSRLNGSEAAVEIGETVAVVGIVSITGEGDARQVSIVADPKHGLLLSDDAA